MKQALKLAFEHEMSTARRLYREHRPDAAFIHLERAHVLGQRYVAPHVLTHWWMLKIGVQRRSLREIAGQAVRMVLGALGSAVGLVPTGNTGGSNVGMFRRMPVDPALRKWLD